MMTILPFLEPLQTWTAFVVWQSFLFLGSAIVFARFFRRSPWQAHLLLTAAIFVSVLAPTVSLAVFHFDGGVIAPGSVFVLEKQSAGIPALLAWSLPIGGVFVGLLLLHGIVSARRLMFHAKPFPDRESQEALLEGARMMQNVSLPILFTSAAVKSPTVWSWGLHPAVLLPERLSEALTPPERDAIFLHEIAHITRRDHWAALSTRLCGIVLFWNPLYWLALKLSDLAADRACDLLVLSREKVSAEIYSETLLRLAAGEKNRLAMNMYCQYLSRKEQLMKRIDTILDFEENRNLFSVTRTPSKILGMVAVLLCLTTAMAFCQEKKTEKTDAANAKPSCEKTADALIARFAKNDFSDAGFTQAMKDGNASGVAKSLWDDFTGQFGKFVRSKAVKTESVLEFKRVHEQCEFENGTAVLMIVVDKNDLVAGLFVMSAEKKNDNNDVHDSMRTTRWHLEQEAQDRPSHIELWNGKANMMSMILAMRFGGRNWLDLNKEQQKRLGFLGKQQEFGVEWFQKMHQEQNAELIAAEDAAKALIPKDDPTFENATPEQKKAYVEALSKPMLLFERYVQNEVAETLTPEQLTKLRSLEFTALPGIGESSPHMFDSLGLSEEQQKKVETIKKEFEPEFLKLLDEQMDLRKEHLVLYTQGKNSDTDRKDYSIRYKEQENRRIEFAKRLRQRLEKDVLTEPQRTEAQKRADDIPGSLKQLFFKAEKKNTETAAEAPKVVKFEPPLNAKDVNPESVTEIRVTFDRNMDTGGFSWCGGDDYPGTEDETPRWVDKRTCVLPVKLAPGKKYRLSINAPSFKNFRSTAGVPVEPIPYSFTTAGSAEKPAIEMPALLPMKDVEKDAVPLPDGLLKTLKEKRATVKSADYTVRSFSERKFDGETRVESNRSRFRFDGSKRWFVDVTEIMGMSDLFQTGCDGTTEWSLIVSKRKTHYQTRRLENIRNIDLSFLDPLRLSGIDDDKLGSSLEGRKIHYLGTENRDGKEFHLFGFVTNREDKFGKVSTRTEIAVDAETGLPDRTRVFMKINHDFNGHKSESETLTTAFFDIEKINAEFTDVDFRPEKTGDLQAVESEKPEEGYDTFFVSINDGSGGRMRVRCNGQTGSKGMSSSGLN